MSAVAPVAVTDVPTRRLGKRHMVLGLGIAAGVAVAVWGAHWWTVGRFIESTDDAYVGADITAISPKVSGYITQVAVTDNQVVHAGDLLAQIDDRDYRAALQKAEGAVAAQQALLANLDANEHLQRAVIDQAHAGIDAAQAESVRARDDQARYRDLSSRAAVSVESAQRADAVFKTARADTEKAQAAFAAAQRQLDVITTQKQQARAALMQAEAERQLAQLNLGYTTLHAPVDGSIGNRRVRLGAFVEAGSPLLAVVPSRGLWIDANFKEDQLAHMKPGQPVTIRADVLPGREFHGRLGSLAPATGAQFSVLPPENATGNFTKIVQRVPVRVLLDERDATLGELRPGLSVTADVDTQASAH
ncbi:HlyD family secretion protein [Dyella sp. GSA-30]|uniref:HlyD family secretion protein n=1 Tax=Dyella sp. GSA-30 TaxID=2994496 RepID=UPI00249057D8|nr:HlyD family secretion protein [Dyella sp. GSA-30]BDU19210.1 hemolysin secretion protein D [Dyella sp. GSA-30]